MATVAELEKALDDLGTAIDDRLDKIEADIAALKTAAPANGGTVDQGLVDAVNHIAGKIGVDMSQFSPKTESVP